MKSKKIIYNIVIAFLCFVFVILLTVSVTEIVDYNRSYHPDESSFLYALEDQDYIRMVDMMHRNQAADIKSSETLEQCYAIAGYYEAATYYKAYRENDNLDAAMEKKERMDEYALLMGDLSYAAEDIDKKLGLE